MPSLEETVGLDIGPALDALDQLARSATESLGDAFSGVVADFSSQLQDAIGELSSAAAAIPDVLIPVDADTVPADEAIAATVSTAETSAPTITVDADTQPAEAEVAAAVAAIDAQDATISVDADTSAAEESISGLGDSLAVTGGRAQAAGGQIGGTVNQVALLGAASKIGAGELGGLSDAGGAVGGGLGIAAGGAFAAAAGIGVLIDKGLGATSALQRFDFIVGDMAQSVLNVNVGSLNTDLDALAIKLGTDDEALRNASATLFQFAINSGSSRREAATFTSQIDALAARAVALNPALGSVADVAETMSVRIARGGRFAASFGLDLNAAEIAARALANTGKESAADLSLYEKSVAGAQLAVEKYGASLDKDITEGSKNAVIQQRSLREQLENVLEAAGKPLVAPFLEATKAAIPDVRIFAETLADLATATLPLVTKGLQVVEGPLRVLASAAAIGTGPLRALNDGLDALSSHDATTAEDVSKLTRVLDDQDLSLTKVSEHFRAASGVRAFREDISQGAATVATFRDVLDSSLPSAERVIDALKRQGRDTFALERLYERRLQATLAQATAEQEAARSADALNVKVGAQAGLVQSAATSLLAYRTGVGSAGQALKDLNLAQQDATDSLSLYTAQLNAAINPQLNFVSTNLAFGNSLIRVSEATSRGADETRTAAQIEAERKSAVIGSVQALIAYAGATAAKEIAEGRASTAQDVANGILAEGSVQLRDQIVALGGTKDAADAFLRSLGLFPGDVKAVAAALNGILTPAIQNLGATVYADGYDAGKQLAAGFGTGMLNNRELADNAAAQLANGAILAARAALEAASPSRRAAREIGVPFSEGIALGITASKDLIAAAATDAVSLRGGVSAAPGRIFGAQTSSSTTHGPTYIDRSTKVERVEVSARNNHPIEMAYGLAKELDVQMHLLGR